MQSSYEYDIQSILIARDENFTKGTCGLPHVPGTRETQIHTYIHTQTSEKKEMRGKPLMSAVRMTNYCSLSTRKRIKQAYTVWQLYCMFSVMSPLIHFAVYGNKSAPSDFEFKKEVNF